MSMVSDDTAREQTSSDRFLLYPHRECLKRWRQMGRVTVSAMPVLCMSEFWEHMHSKPSPG